MKIIYGGPGCGKTNYLLTEVDKALLSGIKPEEICYISFTKKAADEAKTRAIRKFPAWAPRSFYYFRTIHSLAYITLSLTNGQIIQPSDYQAVGKSIGLELTGEQRFEDGMITTKTEDDKLIFIEDLARKKCCSLMDAWREFGDDMSWMKLELYKKTYDEYKRVKALLDYTDMLEQFVDLIARKLKFNVLFLDEAQDLCDLQWVIFSKLCSVSQTVMVAGDDDQAIYKWAGAAVDKFINHSGEKIVLEKSYRLPKVIHQGAELISKQIKQRQPKVFHPRDEEGSIQWHTDIEHVNMSEGDWLVLARNSYLLKEAQEICEREGYLYSYQGKKSLSDNLLKAILDWEFYRGKVKSGFLNFTLSDDQWDNVLTYMRKKHTEGTERIWYEAFTKLPPYRIQYMKSIHDNGEKLTGDPRIKMSTIHSAKGGEATNVIVFSDISYRSFREMQTDPDNELRVLYVAVTRAKKNLHIIQAKTNNSYEQMLWPLMSLSQKAIG